MNNALATIVFGIAASISWGSGDFCGGLASRRANPSNVVTSAYAVGFVLMTTMALLWREPFPLWPDIVWSVLAGLAGAVGLAAFYSALSIGRMGIVAPVSAVLTAAIPAFFSIFIQGPPGLFQVIGFALALLAIALIARQESSKGRPEGLWLALLAGCGFGCFFIFVSRVHPGSTFWPLAIARLTAVLFMLATTWRRRQSVQLGIALTPLVALAGILDALGNAFFVFAAHAGRLDVASILSSLYPAATVILAALILKERVTRIQSIGILIALIAIPLISV